MKAGKNKKYGDINKMKKSTKIIIIILAVLITALFSSCYTPSPLYGTWGDNVGNTISFLPDGSFTSTTKNSMNKEIKTNGNWTCNENVLVITRDSGTRFLSEWDIRGSMLYLDWVDDLNQSIELTLYHISK